MDTRRAFFVNAVPGAVAWVDVSSLFYGGYVLRAAFLAGVAEKHIESVELRMDGQMVMAIYSTKGGEDCEAVSAGEYMRLMAELEGMKQVDLRLPVGPVARCHQFVLSVGLSSDMKAQNVNLCLVMMVEPGR